MTDWTPATPRELLDWLAIFVAPQCDTEERMRMYLGVRDAVVRQMLDERSERVRAETDRLCALAGIPGRSRT